MDTLELGKQRAIELGLNKSTFFDCNENYCRIHNGDVRGAKCPRCKDALLVYPADDIHKLLGEGVETFSMSGDMGISHEWVRYERFASDRAIAAIKSKALLIGIRPIVQESAERQALRELVECWADCVPNSPMDRAVNKAKALLEESK